MNSVIVCVSGVSRTGKDTLINGIAKQLNDRIGWNKSPVQHLSSIDSVKWFTDRTIAGELRLRDDALKGEPTRQRREGWALIKRGLDMMFNYTAELPFAKIRDIGSPTILLYQVREPNNILKIVEKAQQPDNDDVSVVWLHVVRPDRSSDIAFASSEDYRGLDYSHPDVLVKNTSVEGLLDWQCFCAGLILARFHGKRSLLPGANPG